MAKLLIEVDVADDCRRCRFCMKPLGYLKCYLPGREHTIRNPENPGCAIEPPAEKRAKEDK